MSIINLQNIRQAEKLIEDLEGVRQAIEQRINLEKYSPYSKSVPLNTNKVMRICLLAGLSTKEDRDINQIDGMQLSKTGNKFYDTLFTLHNLVETYSALLKIRYEGLGVDWENTTLKSKIVNAEILRGSALLLKDNVLDTWLLQSTSHYKGGRNSAIPSLNLNIGTYEDDIPALLNLNGKEIPNTQILVAGTTGSGKSNLLAVLINEIRSLSIETPYPVNFLLFDYKGEFSDPSNNAWLHLFETDRSSILDPIQAPLPFTPFLNNSRYLALSSSF